ncbi:MAG: prolipoprotein diacylglyceryl transferase, partial [Clostridia bacterium]|nr:prolipoprotein diacylglyceryl transferase [Clostridia bacterium]
MVAQAIGRWGNFVNVEAYGSETDALWRMGILSGGKEIFVHPTFLYESLWNLVGFGMILLLYYKLRFHRFDGQIILTYVAWYGLGRMWIEGLRTDSLYIGTSGIRVSQLIAFLCFVWGTAALIFFLVRTKTPKLATCVYYEDAKHYSDGLKLIETYEKKREEKRRLKEQTRENKQKNNKENAS